MKERPILFSAPMVRALLAGTKTQTRRVVKPQPADDVAPATLPNPSVQAWRSSLRHKFGPSTVHSCPYGQPGDRLWVRETCCGHEITDAEYDGVHLPDPGTDGVRYAADGAFREIENTPEASEDWFRLHSYRGKRGAPVPGIHMPRWASRITLEVTAVRIERLQDISEADCCAEGCGSPITRDLKKPQYRALWESINGTGSWDANPWVWVVSFAPQIETKP